MDSSLRKLTSPLGAFLSMATVLGGAGAAGYAVQHQGEILSGFESEAGAALDDLGSAAARPELRFVSGHGEADAATIEILVLILERTGAPVAKGDFLLQVTTSSRDVWIDLAQHDAAASLSARRDADGSIEDNLVGKGDLIELRLRLAEAGVPLAPRGTAEVRILPGAASALALNVAAPIHFPNRIVELEIGEAS